MKRILRLDLFKTGVLTLMWIFSIAAFSQSRITVQGVVTDSGKETVIGATVIVKGNPTKGTVTDYDGNYTLTDVSADATLVFSYVGTQTQEVAVNGRTTINVVLGDDTELLDEVVVVGYGVQRKSDLTGAVSSVKVGDALKNTPVTDVASSLQGRMAGVSVVSGGDPSSDMTIRVRGVNSINAESGPLVVIDGFIGGNLKNLNPSDIESIEVLKDASSTAVYGSRGANGVLLVTTKSAKDDRIVINFNSFVNFKTVLEYPDTMSPAEYARLANDYGKEYYGSQGQPTKEYYTPQQIQDFESGKEGFDYVKNAFNDPAISQNYELSLSGRSDKIAFLASTRYEKTEGVIRNSSYDQFNWRLKVDVDAKSWLKTGLNFWGSLNNSSGPRMTQYEGLLTGASNFPNTISPTDENGNYNNLFAISGGAVYNPMGYINEIDNNRRELTNHLQGFVDFRIMEGLNFRSQFGVTFNNNLYQNMDNEKSYYYYKQSHTSAQATTNTNKSWLNTNILSYVKEINKDHRINATAVFEQSQADNFMNQSSSTYLAFPNQIGYNNLSWADYFQASSNRVINTMMSGMFRLNYVLMNRYMFTGSIRADGSSRLEDKWDYFPSAAVAWDMKREHFLEDVDWLDQLKVRVGYGSVGNQAVAPYRIYSQMTPVQGSDGTTSYVVDRPKSPYLKWERNEQINFGVDFIALNGRLTANIDVYNKLSKDILLSVAQPVHTGWPELLKNAGSIRNKGIEVTIGANPYRNDNFNWQSDLTLAHNKGVFETIPTPNGMQNQSGNYENKIFKMIEGEKLGTFWGYQYLGVWKTEDMDKTIELADGTTGTNQEIYGVVPGQERYRDINNDGKFNQDDEGIIGNGQPTFNWGWNNTLTFKDFDLNLFVVGYHGFDIYNASRAKGYGIHGATQTDAIAPIKELWNRWTPENQDTDIPGFVKNSSSIHNESARDRFVEKGDFVKVKSITLGYTFPITTLQKVGINNLRIYTSVQNPFHFTSYSGLDPEATLGSPLVQGVDWGAYPNGRNFLLGLNISF